MQPRRRYPSDPSDARWELVRPTLEARRATRAGIRRPTHDLRDLMDAILYVDRTGIPWRWVVERTLGRLMHHRRLARGYETLPARSEAMIHLAMIDLMSRRLTGEATPTGAAPEPQTKRTTENQTLTY
ncbi:transposase [Streptomyces sp. URMC 125]|uniref:transposase n=1 Tax=Streptomyces sp. URMC 125 TaxID=3423419 RepID=UPI003F19BC26